jgi:type IV pilus assembly protein PilB
MVVRLGELLLKEGLITTQQLQEALDLQRRVGGRLADCLNTLGFTTDGQIVYLLSRTYGVPAVNLDDIEIDPAIKTIIPAETAAKYQALAISKKGNTLTVAMADPTLTFAIEDISFMTGYNVEPVVASPIQLEDEIDSCGTLFGLHSGLRRLWREETRRTAQKRRKDSEP